MILSTLQITLPSMAMRLAQIGTLLVALPAVSLLATTITTATGTNTNFAAANGGTQLISEPGTSRKAINLCWDLHTGRHR